MEERSATRPAEARPERVEAASGFLKYTFFKAAREWRSLLKDEKEAARMEFVHALDGVRPGLRLQLFSLVGIRGDADFMVLAGSAKLEPFQELVSALLSTRLGRYLDIPYSYLAMTRRSHYTGSHPRLDQEGVSGAASPPKPARYLFVYPFVKKRSWYGLPFAERQRIMGEHFRVGRKYPDIKINTGYSFGLDDQEFVLAFEGDDPADFLALVEELRGTEASKYTELETPIFTCLRCDAAQLVRLLG